MVLNYNGMNHLDDCLSSALQASQNVEAACRVVLVDNQSTDGSAEYVKKNFPSVELIITPQNNFLFSLNDILKERSEEVIIIVNNDMRFAKNFIPPLLVHFEDPEVFAVGAAIYTWDGSTLIVGQRRAEKRRFWFYKWWNYEMESACLTLEASAGAAAYRRKFFLKLGGFDELYMPGYYEDMDLSFRAWEKGWRVIYEPKSIVCHRESASMVSRYGVDGKAKLLYRNHLLFTLKNIGGGGFLMGFLMLLPIRVIRPLFKGYEVPFKGFLAAIPCIPKALRGRLRRQIRNQEFLRIFVNNHESID
jgi:GT2 family glycosyltransferase